MREWSYFTNPFLTCTAKSNRKALRIGRYHDNALAAKISNTYILGLYNDYHPNFVVFRHAYNAHKSQLAVQQGATQILNELLDELSSTKIQDWDIAIQGVYKQPTAQYKVLLPDRRKPFQQGSQGDRLSAVETLSGNLASDSSLAAVKTSVDAFAIALDTAMGVQQGCLSDTEDKSQTLELARVVMCESQFANLGSFICHFPNDPSQTAEYFDLKTIRNPLQTEWTGTLKPLEIKTVVQRTLDPSDKVILENTSDSYLVIYTSNMKDGSPQGTGFDGNPHSVVEIPVTQFGDLSNTYLIIKNVNAVLTGSYVLEIV